MLFKLFCHLGALMPCFFETASAYCYNTGDAPFSNIENFDSIITEYCQHKTSQLYSIGDDVSDCFNSGNTHLDIKLTITDVTESSQKLYFSMDACRYVLKTTKDAFDAVGCTSGGEEVVVSYQGPVKRNTRERSSRGDYGDDSDYYEQDDDMDTSGGQEQAGGVGTSDEYEQGDGDTPDVIKLGEDDFGDGSTTTLVISSDTTASTTMPTSASTVIVTTVVTSTPRRKKHKTSGEEKYQTVMVTGTTTMQTTETTSMTATITTFVSTTSFSSDSSGSTNIYFKGNLKLDPQHGNCG